MSDEEMINRVSRAILMTPNSSDYETLVAKRAIEAMREPTNKMKNAESIHWGYSCHVCGGLQEGWYAMIDEILKN